MNEKKNEVARDAEQYILEGRLSDARAAGDDELDGGLTEVRENAAGPPGIIPIMRVDRAFGEAGISHVPDDARSFNARDKRTGVRRRLTGR